MFCLFCSKPTILPYHARKCCHPRPTKIYRFDRQWIQLVRYHLLRQAILLLTLSSSFLFLSPTQIKVIISHKSRFCFIFHFGFPTTVSFLIFEYPQNLALQRFPVGKWLAFNAFGWAVFVSLQAVSLKPHLSVYNRCLGWELDSAPVDLTHTHKTSTKDLRGGEAVLLLKRASSVTEWLIFCGCLD